MKRFQFSKLLVAFCFLLALGGIGFVAYATLFLYLDTTVGISIVGACGTILATTLIFYLKKSQAENTLKIYLATYKEIVAIKKENQEDVQNFIEGMENNIEGKISSTLDTAIYDATSPIEKENLI